MAPASALLLSGRDGKDAPLPWPRPPSASVGREIPAGNFWWRFSDVWDCLWEPKTAAVAIPDGAVEMEEDKALGADDVRSRPLSSWRWGPVENLTS